jgi:hypothetical protein
MTLSLSLSFSRVSRALGVEEDRATGRFRTKESEDLEDVDSLSAVRPSLMHTLWEHAGFTVFPMSRDFGGKIENRSFGIRTTPMFIGGDGWSCAFVGAPHFGPFPVLSGGRILTPHAPLWRSGGAEMSEGAVADRVRSVCSPRPKLSNGRTETIILRCGFGEGGRPEARAMGVVAFDPGPQTDQSRTSTARWRSRCTPSTSGEIRQNTLSCALHGSGLVW